MIDNSNSFSILLCIIIVTLTINNVTPIVTDTDLNEDICLLPIDEGDCEGIDSESISTNEDLNSTVVFGYNINTSKCEEFIYDGCDGNDNRFVTAKECWQACYTPLNYFLARVSDLLLYRYSHSNLTVNNNITAASNESDVSGSLSLEKNSLLPPHSKEDVIV